MKKEDKTLRVLYIILLVVSLAANIVYGYYFYNNPDPNPDFRRFGFGEHDIEVYCDVSEDVKAIRVMFSPDIFKIGKAELHSREDLYLVTPEGEFNLSEMGGDAYIINSDGEILYKAVKADK